MYEYMSRALNGVNYRDLDWDWKLVILVDFKTQEITITLNNFFNRFELPFALERKFL
jgi:hypothetical protein